MDVVTLIRWVVGVPIILVGSAFLCLNLCLFAWGVMGRRHVPSSPPLIDLPIFVIGFLALPIPNNLLLGLALGCLSSGIGMWVNRLRP